jgi:quinol monooxygenase YgiN
MIAAPAFAQAPPAATGSVYVVTYFESAPAAANKVGVALRQFAAATRKEAGNTAFVALQETGRPNRFALMEAWQDKAALDGHEKTVAALKDRLRPELAAPFDRRPCVGLDVAATAARDRGTGSSVYVLNHVDVVPTFKDQTIELVKELVTASRKGDGEQRFDAVQQGNRPNHMFLVEVWRDRTALAAHTVAASTRDFRDKLLPMQGALYDERVYTALR